jgi:hypothetical protein
MKLFDVFICHASEDKDAFVRPLAKRLEEEHLFVWYDEFSLRMGDSLRRSIDIGLARSRYGVVVLSHAFFAKQWPQRELDGLVARETIAGERVILPVWHGLSKAEVCGYSPTLADLVAVSSASGVEHVVQQVLRAVRPAGSPLVIARDRLIGLGMQPPVVTDEWWLDVVEASNREYPWGMVPYQEPWGRWSFPLPEASTVYERGERLARTATQMAWVTAADAQGICQVTPPGEVLAFIRSQPGMEEACHQYPLFLATYAPQLTMPGFGGEFEADFDALLAKSGARCRGHQSGSATTVTGVPPHCDEYIAFRHPNFGGYEPAYVACQFVQGDIGGPPCKAYETVDYAVWLLSQRSYWLPERVREFLITGMKEWAVWLWSEGSTVDERELGIDRYDGKGALADRLLGKRPSARLKVGSPAYNDLLIRVQISKQLLDLPESAQELVDRFLEKGFIESLLADRRSSKTRRKAT